MLSIRGALNFDLARLPRIERRRALAVRGYLESRQAVAKKDVNRASPVDEHALESDAVDARIQY